jgi:hypothetical protein
MKISRIDKQVAIISFGGVIGMILLALAGQLGFAYWWPAVCIVGPATIAWALWVSREPKPK